MPSQNHVFRISRAYNVLSEVIPYCLADTADQVIVYEHQADEAVQRTHCHFLIKDCHIGIEGIKKRILKCLKLSGNGDWSFSTKDHTDTDKYITYMSKGQLDPVFSKGYQPPYIDALKALWADKPVETLKAEPLIVREATGNIKKELNLTDLYEAYADELLGRDIEKMSPHLTLDSFRGPSLLFWRKRYRILPQTSTYKRFLASVFLDYRDLKRLPLSDDTLDQIKNFYG